MRHRPLARTGVWLVLVVLLALWLELVRTTEPADVTQASAQPAAPVWGTVDARGASEAALRRLTHFRVVWQLIDRYYVDPSHGGLDWAAVRARYEPQILAAPDDATAHRLLAQMVALLDDGHTQYLGPEATREADALAAGVYAYAGIGTLVVARPEALVVLEVLPDSPAAAAGLRRRDQIRAVDGHQWSPDCGEPCAVRGPAGTLVTLSVRSPDGVVREHRLVRAAVSASLRVTAERLGGDSAFGYLRIPTFQAPAVGAEVDAGLRRLLAEGPLAGLIIDLRHNGGGRRSMLEAVLGQLVNGDQGTFVARRSSTALTVAPGPLRAVLAELPVVVLSDERTASAAEVLTGALQQAGRACIIGRQTAGNVELVSPYDLPNGARLLLARASFRLRDGAEIDGRGVVPDVAVEADWVRFTEQDDPYLLAAMRVLGNGSCR